jgi:hypothetical protein
MTSGLNGKCLWVKGTDGIGNRLLSLEFACRYAAKHRYGVHVDWRDDIAMMDKRQFLEIFSIQGVPVLGSPDPVNFVSPYPSDLRFFTEPDIKSLVTQVPLFSRIPRKFAFWRRTSRFNDAYRYHGGARTALRNGQHLTGLAEKHDLLCFCCSLPWREPEHFRHVKLRCEMIEEVLQRNPSLRETNDLSLHIRNTDKSSPEIKRAIRAVLNLLERDPSLRTMHLATDNAEAAKEVMESLGDLLEIQMLEIPRDSDPIHLRMQTASEKAEMLRLAVVDIHLLASARYLLFQSNSSFSRVAVALQSSQSDCADWTSFAG